MKFELTGKVTQEKWSDTSKPSYLYAIEEKQKDKTKIWFIWTSEALILQTSYNIEGYITETKDKVKGEARKDTSGKDIWKSNYNATVIVANEDFPF
jgi:hypothetical protein